MTRPAIDPPLTSTRNRRVVEVAGLHDRRRRRRLGLTLIEGPAQIADAAAGGASVVEVFAVGAGTLPGTVDAPVTLVSEPVLERMAGTAHPRGPLAVVRIPPPAPLRPTDTVVLWDLADPGNAGAIVRSAAAFGFDVAVTDATTDVWAPKAVRAAAATQYRTAIVELGTDPLAQLTAAGLVPVASVAGGGTGPTGLPDVPIALLVGSEAHGLPEDVVAASAVVSVPLRGGVESLNAAVAAGILMHLRDATR